MCSGVHRLVNWKSCIDPTESTFLRKKYIYGLSGNNVKIIRKVIQKLKRRIKAHMNKVPKMLNKIATVFQNRGLGMGFYLLSQELIAIGN